VANKDIPMDWDWRRLENSPTDCNDDHKLELPRAWDPLNN
jgi:hypothetical protein